MGVAQGDMGMKPKFDELFDALKVISDTGLCPGPVVGGLTEDGCYIHIAFGKHNDVYFGFDNDDNLVDIWEE